MRFGLSLASWLAWSRVLCRAALLPRGWGWCCVGRRLFVLGAIPPLAISVIFTTVLVVWSSGLLDVTWCRR